MRPPGARPLTVTAAQASANARLLGGPLRLLGWSFTSGAALSTEFTPANPAAGTADATVFTVAAGVSQILNVLSFTFVTDATVGNRVVRIEIRDGTGNVVARQTCLTADPASTTSQVSAFISSTGTGGASGVVNVPLPSTTMQAGWTVHITVTGTVGAADQISAITGEVISPAVASAANILDGGQIVGVSALPAGGIDTQPLLDSGVEIATSISVQATVGTLSGVLWYILPDDIKHGAAWAED